MLDSFSRIFYTMAERPEDLNLPNAVITRIIKDSLPDGVAVAKEARSAIAKAASVFVLYTTSTANSLAQKNKKKTVSAQDVFNAMKEMEFEKFIEPLQESLEGMYIYNQKIILCGFTPCVCMHVGICSMYVYRGTETL